MSLWCQIAKEKNSSLKFNISSLKVINKYYNWNKRWKEVRDSAGSRGSGTEAKYFRQEKAFDQLYGTKASTKPACILNTFDYKEEETTTNKKKPTQIKTKWMKIRVLTRPARKIEERTRRELERPLALWKHWKNGILNLQINWSNFTSTNWLYSIVCLICTNKRWILLIASSTK